MVALHTETVVYPGVPMTNDLGLTKWVKSIIVVTVAGNLRFALPKLD
jgi:hypothetical protein